MRKFNSHSIPTRLNLLFAIVILLFMTIIGRLLYMQVVNKDFYEAKLASASQTRVTTGSARGEIYDAAGKPLVENTVKQVVAFTRSNKMTATDLKDISTKLLTYVTVSSPDLTERQIADYYLADPAVYKTTVTNFLNRIFITMLLRVLPLAKLIIQRMKRRLFISLVSSMQLEILQQAISKQIL